MTVNNMVQNQFRHPMMRIASGLRINSAADDAAGLGISEGMTAIIRGLEQGIRNTQDMQNLVHTAEGGMANIGESLIRMRELSIQASNDTLTERDRQNIQHEIDQLMDEIDATTERTEFNGRRLLDGSFSAEDGRGLHTAADAHARGPTVHIGNMSAGMIMGPEPYDITQGAGGFDIRRLDNAMSRVNSERSNLGAMSNRFDTTISSNQIANLNLQAARSGIRDQDMARGMMEVMLERIREQAEVRQQRQQQERERLPMLGLLT